MSKSGLAAFLIKELKELVPPTVFFAVGFNLIVLTTDLILADYVRTLQQYRLFYLFGLSGSGWSWRCQPPDRRR